MKIGVLGAGSMGAGIAQVAAQSGHPVVLVDTQAAQLEKAKSGLAATLEKLVAKDKLSAADSTAIQGRITYGEQVELFKSCDLVIEAIIENSEVKKKVFAQLETVVAEKCILASNTSSLS